MADSTPWLDQLSTATANNELRVNELVDAVSPAGIFAYRASTSSGVTWGYYGGRIGGTAVAAGTTTLATGTRYIVADRSTWAVSNSSGTTNWNDTATYARLYVVVCASSLVLSYEDHRFGAGGIFSAGSVGRHQIYVPARLMSPSASGGCAALATIATSANQPDIESLNFDAVTQEFAQFSMAMPKRWDDGTVTFLAIWSHASGGTAFGCVWQLQGRAVSDDDTIATTYGTAQTSTDTGGTANDLYRSPESSAITLAGTPQPEDVVFWRVARVPANGSDTLDIDARLHGVVIYVSTGAENDA